MIKYKFMYVALFTYLLYKNLFKLNTISQFYCPVNFCSILPIAAGLSFGTCDGDRTILIKWHDITV